ncbi:MAG: PEP-CTERM sorting domain-containing protein [Candidatus Omnitrophota bacterium]
MRKTSNFISLLIVAVLILTFSEKAWAVSFSVERGATGTEESALEASYGTGTVPNNVYNSDLSGTNTVGSSGQDTGTSGTQGFGGFRPGQDIDAIFFGNPIAPESISKYFFSLDYGAGYYTGPYPSGSGTEAAQGTGTAPSNVYMSTGDGTNVNPYPYSGPDLGIEPYTGSNLDAFNLEDFTSPNSYPLYFSLDLNEATDIDFDEDGTSDITVGGGDILISNGNGIFSTFLTSAGLGLSESDNLDALARLSDGSWLFSVDYGSYGLEGSAVFAAAGTGRRPANIYRSFGDGSNSLWLSSEALGLPSGRETEGGWGPNLDAFDIAATAAAIPEPTTMSLLGFGLLGLLGLRKKK